MREKSAALVAAYTQGNGELKEGGYGPLILANKIQKLSNNRLMQFLC